MIMTLRSLIGSGVAIMTGLIASGCYSPETDYTHLVEENNSLSMEVEVASRENEILNLALSNIEREQETLQLLVKTSKRELLDGGINLLQAPTTNDANPPATSTRVQTTPAPSAISTTRSTVTRPPARPPAISTTVDEGWQTPEIPTAPTTSNRTYIIKPGDILSDIALTNQTTVDKILELNPKLRSRQGNMIFDNEHLNLP